MLIIQMNEWLGPGVRMPAVEATRTAESNRLVSFATHLTLGKALERLKEYQEAYNAHYSLAVNFSLLSVSTVNPVDPSLLEYFRMDMVENLEMPGHERSC